MADYTPMMQQYWEVKHQYEDCILFFRLGDFYEMFFDDAKLASRELELALTKRSCGKDEFAPMCGVPFHSYESYAAKLVANGHKVAICEQVEDPALAKDLVSREVIRVITPGTVIEGCMLDEEKNNYLCALYRTDDGAVGLCFTDCSTGDIHVTEIAGEDVILRVTSELVRFSPSEILLNRTAAQDEGLLSFIHNRLTAVTEQVDEVRFDPSAGERRILSHFEKASLSELGLAETPAGVRVLGCALYYLQETQMTGLERVNQLNVYSDAQFMRLDATARRNLELMETMRGKEKRGSLLGVLDHTRTAMGKRLLRSWMEQPLINAGPITRRLSAVQELTDSTRLRRELMEILSGVYDLERIMTRIVYGTANARELSSLAATLSCVVPLKEQLTGVSATLLRENEASLDPLEDVKDRISRAIVDEPPFSVREGGMIRKGYNAELDELLYEMTDGQSIITRVENEEKENTGIKGLKVGYNRVFGYYIEISKSYTGEVPERYIRKQTLANAERYITPELKELETRVLGAKERAVALEYQLFNEVRMAVIKELHRIQATAHAIAELDVLCSFAETAVRHHYCCPVVDRSASISIVGGRHPVVESLSDKPFVPNDTVLDDGENRVLMITGPNMAGKSTYMRQTALIVLMAQIGSFVPADSATIGIVDGIYTRVGASDDLSSGQSTFMVEMNEVATILRNATRHSLIIFDEIGRGTSTFDGMSIARAVLEYVANPKKVGAKTLFATHYHELTSMEEEMDCVKNYNIAVKKRGDDITFLRRIVRGPADDSYGIEVAKLAGVPDWVVSRAKVILKDILNGDMAAPVPAAVRSAAEPEPEEQLSLLGTAETNPILQQLRDLDVNTLTPIEALQLLYSLSKEAQAY